MEQCEVGFVGGQQLRLDASSENLVAALTAAAAKKLTWFIADGVPKPYLISIPHISYVMRVNRSTQDEAKANQPVPTAAAETAQADYEIGFMAGQRVNISTSDPHAFLEALRQAALSGATWFNTAGEGAQIINIMSLSYLVPSNFSAVYDAIAASRKLRVTNVAKKLMERPRPNPLDLG